jgi:hypothetical protein
MRFLRVFVAPAVLLATFSAAQADKPTDHNRSSPGLGWAHGKAVPGPIAGAGLPILVVAGAYVWMRQRRRAKPEIQNRTPGT